ncbi:hypothetical protein [Microbacterium sp. P05]|uniref:hypothetical protein n=1 Tax=Microbacterium sp. P05 TaxID=3366948 RepID=UPI0037457CC2
MSGEFVYEFDAAGRTTMLPGSPRLKSLAFRLPTLLGQPGRSTLSVWRLAPGQHLFDVTPETMPSTFLQAAGTAEAMSIEWRRVDDDGVERLYTLGHGGSRRGAPTVEIAFQGGAHSVWVYPDEVFQADEAGEILLRYFETQTVPGKYVLREFDLTWPKP